MIIGISGHRPEKLGSYKTPNPIYNFVMAETAKVFAKYKPNRILIGMCIGYDQYVAELAIKLKIPFTAAVPFLGQELLWPKDTQKYYQHLLAHADRLEIINPGAFASWKMHARNQWIVNNSDMLLAAYDNSTSGGTYHCVSYALEQNKTIKIINPSEARK